MSRMLEALKLIQANLPPTPGGVEPVLPDDIEVSVPGSLAEEEATPDPPQAAEPGETLEPIDSVEQVAPSEPLETDGSAEVAEEAIADQAVADEMVPEDTITEAATAEENVAEEVAPEEIVAEEVTEEETATEEVAAEEAVAEKPAAEEIVTEEVDDEEAAGEETVVDERVTDEAVAEQRPEADDGAEPDRDVVCLLSPRAERHKEQYHSLADNILAQLPPGRPAVLLFTSVAEREGKTGMLASLSVVLAEKLSDEIVAVDANLRNPCLASHFGIWAEQGLIDVLSAGANWREVVRQTTVKRLSVLPGGRLSDDGSLPGDVALSPVLDALRLHYRIVLVDAASLAYPEVAPLGRLCEGTYLVAELGHTPRGAARRAVRVLERCGGRVLGCVLTGEPSRQ